MKGSYLEAEARGVDLDSKTVTCTYSKPFIGAHFNERSFDLPYDVLVVAVSPDPFDNDDNCSLIMSSKE